VSTSAVTFEDFSAASILLEFEKALPHSMRSRAAAAAVPAQIPMHEILSALSFALDLTEGAVPGHAVRSCLYGMRIADELGLPEHERVSLYYALLLKDIGCSSNSARMCMLIGGDDRQMKHDVKFVDWTRPSVAAVTALWRQALPEASPVKRSSRILKLALEQHRNNREMIELRCDRGASIARKIGLGEATAEAIRLLDEHWDGSGYPERRKGQAIPVLARIVAIAQHLDVFASEQGLPKAMHELVERNGRWFDPELVKLTRCLYSRGALSAAVGNFDHHRRVVQIRPGAVNALAATDIDRICEAFADVVDAKSSFTYSHSLGVTRVAMGIAAELGFNAARRTLVRRSALLHDLGKLSVSNTILDKPGKLTGEEWAIVQRHPLVGQQILERISHFGAIATVAGQHHEKLDGSGYPYRLSGRQLSLDSRVVALADVFAALSESRPYRQSLEIGQVIAILEQDVPGKLDPDCFEALLRYLHSAPFEAA
jgi:putative nucleotidyltransferase with HDIG domain